MLLTDEQKMIIIDCGAYGYDSNRIAGILEVDVNQIEKQLKEVGSEINQLYQKGVYRAEYVIDKKLFELAQAGDIKALEKLELRKKLRNAKGKQKAH